MFFVSEKNNRRLKIVLLIFGAYFFWVMLKITLDYIPLTKTSGFLMIKQTEVAERPEYLSIFYTHVFTSIFTLLSGIFAISRIDFGLKTFHSFIGKMYIFLVLLFSAPSGIYMGFHANGGFFSKISFVLLGTLWWLSTYKAYQFVLKKQFKAHKIWMYRSFALTFSAITLRFWKVVLVQIYHPNPIDVYQIIAWLGWIPNLLFIEYLIKTKKI